MQTLRIENTCHATALRPGATIHCREGVLWITMESRQPRQSPDVVLTAGDALCIVEPGDYFLSAPGRDNRVVCHVDRSAEQAAAMPWLRWAGPARTRP